MAGLLDALVGSNDPSTADPNTGLVESQRRQLLYSTLGQTGAALLAAGAPTMPGSGQQQQAFAQLGNVPGNVQRQGLELQQGNALQQRTVAERVKNQQQAELMKYTQTPEFQQAFEGLPTAQKSVAMAMLKSGDVAGVLKTLQEAHAETQPKFNADGSVYDPKTGDILFPQTGEKYNLRAMQNGQAQQPGSLSGAPGNQLHGDDYLKTLAPSFAGYVKGIAEGREAMPQGQIMRTQYGQRLMGALNQYEPGFDQTNYGARLNTNKAFASGKEAQAVRSLNQVTQHMQVLHDKAAALDNTGSPIVNQGYNTVAKTVFGSTAPTDFVAAAHPVAEELSRAFKGANLSDSEVRQWEQSLNRDMSPAQMQGAMETMQHLLAGAQDALSEQYKKTMGRDLNPITPNSAKAIEYIKTHPLNNREIWPENQQRGPVAQGSTPAVAPGQPNQPAAPPVQGARQAPDGKWYVPDPSRPGKFLMVQ